MKDIVLIGATGYVGTALMEEALLRGFNITAAVRFPEKLPPNLSNLKGIKTDVTVLEEVIAACEKADTVVSAYNPGWDDPDIYDDILNTYPIIIEGAKTAGVKRLLIVGGAGSLFVNKDTRMVDSGHIPHKILPGVKGLSEVYTKVLLQEGQLDWVFLAPSANLFQGERTGKFRIGTDMLLVNEKGESSISVQDYAVAMMDEVDKPTHHKEMFTVGY
ncbi:MAG: NAD(P)H-binding protein [Bacteroides sp.]|nr:NAD(P)H-binding protein [Bacteroides sp.]